MNGTCLQNAAMAIAQADVQIALTGAGISVESGIPDFRSPDGLWKKYNPDEFATLRAFLENPAKVWQFFRDAGELLAEASPNPAHLALAKLESAGKLKAIVTQNIDGLHKKAGSRNVVELHGSSRSLSCLNCTKSYDNDAAMFSSIPPICPVCSKILKPDVVLFGENLPPEALKKALHFADRADLVIIIGTSGEVEPAASLPCIIHRKRGTVIEVNTGPTRFTPAISDFFLEGDAGAVVPELVSKALDIIRI